MPRLRSSPRQRFYALVDRTGPPAALRPELGRCYLWTGGRDPRGYPIFCLDGRREIAYRVAYGWEVEPLPRRRRLEHFACGRPDCVNVDHLRPMGNRWWQAPQADGAAAWSPVGAQCPNGHVLTAPVTAPGRLECRACAATAAAGLRGLQRRLGA